MEPKEKNKGKKSSSFMGVYFSLSSGSSCADLSFLLVGPQEPLVQREEVNNRLAFLKEEGKNDRMCPFLL